MKKQLKGMRFRVWCSFLALIVLLLFFVYILQIYMIDHNYEEMKIVSTEKVIAEIRKHYDAEYSQEELVKELNNLTDADDTYVEIIDNDVENNSTNTAKIYTNASGINTYQVELEKLQMSLKNSDKPVKMTMEGRNASRKSWGYAVYLDEEQKTELYCITPLYPVNSTVEILRSQYIYIVFLAFATACVFAIILSYHISKPLHKLTKEAQKLATGRYGMTFPTTKQYLEVEELSIALNKASTQLEKSANFQRDIIANVSHDLKTPLTMVKSYAEMIRDLSGDFPEKRNEHLQIIIDESDRLNMLIQDILTLSETQAGQLKLKITAFSIKELFESVLKTYTLLEEEGYDIKLTCHRDVHVVGDPDKIKQVIANFVSNAIKYCGSDKKIRINIKHWGNKVHCEIIDHGQGIAREELQHIWERYYQTSTNHVRPTKGSGIGLSIVKEILLAHNARFGAESRVGKGSTFWFELEVASEGFINQIEW